MEHLFGFECRPHQKVMLVQDLHVGFEEYFELRRKEAKELLHVVGWYSTPAMIGSRASQAIQFYNDRIVQVEVM